MALIRLSKTQAKAVHAILNGVLIGVAASVQAVVSSGTWTWHALALGVIGGSVSGLAGWYLREHTDGAPPAATPPTP